MSDLMITEHDVASFHDKLHAWGSTLSDGERAVLQMMLVRAFPESGSPAEPDVEGFGARDVSTGQATGRRQYQPLRIVKQVDVASPLLAPQVLAPLVGTPFSIVGPDREV